MVTRTKKDEAVKVTFASRCSVAGGLLDKLAEEVERAEGMIVDPIAVRAWGKVNDALGVLAGALAFSERAGDLTAIAELVKAHAPATTTWDSTTGAALVAAAEVMRASSDIPGDEIDALVDRWETTVAALRPRKAGGGSGGERKARGPANPDNPLTQPLGFRVQVKDTAGIVIASSTRANPHALLDATRKSLTRLDRAGEAMRLTRGDAAFRGLRDAVRKVMEDGAAAVDSGYGLMVVRAGAGDAASAQVPATVSAGPAGSTVAPGKEVAA